jgi:two-component system, sensor histidine kinase and response regulator
LSPREAIEDYRTTRDVPADVLAWAEMELADVPDLELEPFDLHLLVEQTAARFAPRSRARGIALEVKTAPSVPRQVVGEPVWLGEVLCSLLDNALKFTAAGEVVASISSDRTAGARVLLHVEVSDTGAGMTADQVAREFGPQRRRRRFDPAGTDGTGGVRIAQRLVELMDGQIGCSSALGMGTTTWFTVPLDIPGR